MRFISESVIRSSERITLFLYPQSLCDSPKGHAAFAYTKSGGPVASIFRENLADTDAAALMRLINLSNSLFLVVFRPKDLET